MTHTGLKLGVNVDHVATLRQARGTTYPSPVEAARLCARAGAHGITVHLREDRRHIQDRDVEALCRERVLPLNLEMANTPGILAIALALQPDEVCLVPEKREELTTEGGLDAAGQYEALRGSVEALAGAGIVTSLFIEPDERQLEAAASLGAPYVELHTGTFCDANEADQPAELRRLQEAARSAHARGLKVNAGHGLHLGTMAAIATVPHLDTLNIGHSIIARAVFLGLERAVREILKTMEGYEPGAQA